MMNPHEIKVIAENPNDVEVLDIKDIEVENDPKKTPRITFVLVSGRKKTYEGEEYKYMYWQALLLKEQYWFEFDPRFGKTMRIVIKTHVKYYYASGLRFTRRIYRVIKKEGVFSPDLFRVKYFGWNIRITGELQRRIRDNRTADKEKIIYIKDDISKNVFENI